MPHPAGARGARGLAAALGAVILRGGMPAVAQQPPAAPEQTAEPPIVRLPPLDVTTTRLPSTPLPVDRVPAAVDIVPGEALLATGAVTLQDALRRLPGVTTADQQGNSFQMDLSLRG